MSQETRQFLCVRVTQVAFLLLQPGNQRKLVRGRARASEGETNRRQNKRTAARNRTERIFMWEAEFGF